MDVFSFIGGADVHKVSLIPEYYKQGKFINDADVSITRPDGSIRWVMLSLFSTTDQKGLRTGLLTLVDVTKQKQVDTAKTEFVSLASHQLRTPISGMKWNLELLQSGGNDQFTTLQSGYIEKIKHGLERMDLLVTDFLSVSKFELGTLTPTYTSVALEPFLLAVHEELRAFAEQRAVTVFTEWDDTLSSLQSDAHLLHMIVSNLLGNAIKYTMQGGEVRIKAHESEGVFTLTITDTGIGIPLDEQGRVFSKMFRAQNAQVQVSEGTGLGLYIVQEAVQILGGSISFVSTEKVGTTFTVVLPKP
jgi:signal transduction histidine kinase